MPDPLSYIETARIAPRLQQMVRLETTNPPGRNYGDMVSLLEQYCRDLGLVVSRHRVPDKALEEAGVDTAYPRYNLVARWNAGARRTVHYNAHYDVVPATGSWRHGDPFSATTSADRLYGRGSGDMKGSIAALLAAVEALRRTGSAPACNIECSFTADEETGGLLGAGYVVEHRLLDADYVVVCEGASASKIGLGHNGVFWLEVTVHGKSAHAASPDQGVNAFEAMTEIVHHLRPLKRRLAAATRRYRDHGGQVRNPTVNIGGVFFGHGQKVNTVPGDAVFTIDRRITPGERLSQAEAELRRAVKQAAARVPGIRCSVRPTLRIDPCVVDADHDLPLAFARSVRSVRRGATGFKVTSGFTDLHYFVQEGGLPGIGYGVDGRRAHGVDESVRLRDVVQTARTYAHFMMRGV